LDKIDRILKINGKYGVAILGKSFGIQVTPEQDEEFRYDIPVPAL